MHALEAYLHAHIPLSASMGVSVVSASGEEVILRAPLEPNINHKSTVFGGSASALAILAAWSLLHLRLTAEGLHGQLVIQSNRIDYDRPMTGAFMAAATLADPAAWPLFVRTLTRHRRARIEALSTLSCGNAVTGRLSGRFVALLMDEP
ncbi:MAG: YiiD C-terminal domain-containing protein [Proteobacteria bacterium]|nr:YiiD C-terminal domain-containing protein [Pseudomonadota bacterium]